MWMFENLRIGKSAAKPEKERSTTKKNISIGNAPYGGLIWKLQKK